MINIAAEILQFVIVEVRMTSRYRRQQQSADQPSTDPLPNQEDRTTRLLIGIALATSLALVCWMVYKWKTDQEESSAPVASKGGPDHRPSPPIQQQPKTDTRTTSRGGLPHKDTGKEALSGGFLEAFGKGDAAAEGDDGAAPGSPELEQHFQQLCTLREQIKELTRKKGDGERDKLLERYEKDIAALEKDLARARRARADDAVPQWLTGELLLQVGGAPEKILPFLRRAADAGLVRPRLFASLSLAQTDTNQFAAAFDSALKALEKAGQDRYVWNAFTRAAFNLERFAEVAERLDQAFPGKQPDWVRDIRREAFLQQVNWDGELKLRRAESKADDLPRVRLVVEHRRFVRGPDGKLLSTSEATGKGEVLLELFEDQAPATVANFLSLVAEKFYDGTRFYVAEPATGVAGGDPNTRNDDPSDDGGGGPGYAIPDEFQAAGARRHFRGALSMVNSGPGTAGSQFFLTVVPVPSLDGQYTVFGRVIQGQDVVDRITLGRTTPEVGRFGSIIPGDVLVRAEVIRKRPHEYRPTKLPRQ